jgi:hypothetical protein
VHGPDTETVLGTVGWGTDGGDTGFLVGSGYDKFGAGVATPNQDARMQIVPPPHGNHGGMQPKRALSNCARSET